MEGEAKEVTDCLRQRGGHDAQDTDYTGYDFWLIKLNQFNGNYINAEMVKASSHRLNIDNGSDRESAELT